MLAVLTLTCGHHAIVHLHASILCHGEWAMQALAEVAAAIASANGSAGMHKTGDAYAYVTLLPLQRRAALGQHGA